MSSSSSSSQVSGYRYYMGLHFGLCHGPVDEVVEIRVGSRSAWTGSVAASGSINIDNPDLFGGDKKEGGVSGRLDVMMGESTQLPNAYLTEQQGAVQPAYRRLLTMVARAIYLCANNPYPKPWKFRVRRAKMGWQADNPWLPDYASITMSNGAKGMNGAHIIYECLTNGDWGMGYPTSQIDSTSFTNAAEALYNEGFGLCLYWSRQDTIESFCQTVIDHIGAVLVNDRETGLFVLKLLRDDYTQSDLKTFTNDNVLDVQEYDAPGTANTTNEIIVKYVDPTLGPKSQSGNQIVMVQALGSIQAQGVVLSETKEYPGIPSADLALRVAQRDLRAVSTFLKRIKMTVDRNAWACVPGDCFVLTFSPLGISAMVFRVGEIDYGTLDSGAITITGIQDVFALPDASYVSVPTTGWTAPNTTATAPTHVAGFETS